MLAHIEAFFFFSTLDLFLPDLFVSYIVLCILHTSTTNQNPTDRVSHVTYPRDTTCIGLSRALAPPVTHTHKCSAYSHQSFAPRTSLVPKYDQKARA